MTDREALIEKLERYRAVTLATLDVVPEERLAWSPVPELFTFAQHFHHIFQTEDYYAHGLLAGDWNFDRIRMPKALPSRASIRERLLDIRRYTLERLEVLDDEALRRTLIPPNFPVESTIRGWFEFVLEHEIHHRSQTAVYLRLIGITPPFYAAIVPGNERPDIEARRLLDEGVAFGPAGAI